VNRIGRRTIFAMLLIVALTILWSFNLPTEDRHAVSLALANGGIRNQNSLFEQVLMPGCLARSLSGRATTQQVLVTVLRHPFGAR
jgi:hypothetical protein